MYLHIGIMSVVDCPIYMEMEEFMSKLTVGFKNNSYFIEQFSQQ